MKYSATQFAKAAATADTVAKQAQAMEQVNVDVVDFVNQVFAFEHDKVPKANQFTPRNVDDIKYLVAQATFRLRLILEVCRVDTDENEDLSAEVSYLEREVTRLKEELEIA